MRVNKGERIQYSSSVDYQIVKIDDVLCDDYICVKKPTMVINDKSGWGSVEFYCERHYDERISEIRSKVE